MYSFKIFNFNSSKIKYFHVNFIFPYFISSSFLKILLHWPLWLQQILLLSQSVSRGMLQKGLLANTFFSLVFFYLFIFSYTKVRNKLGKYFISFFSFSYLFIIEHFCLVLLVLLLHACIPCYSQFYFSYFCWIPFFMFGENMIYGILVCIWVYSLSASYLERVEYFKG